MISFILWYLLISVVGWLAFPLAFRLLANLPDRGFALARPLGLLVWGYSFWLLASFQVLENNPGGILCGLLILAVLSFVALRGGGWDQIRAWLRTHSKQVLISELLFLAAFAFWAFIRAMNPDVSGTEKPMEMAFINSILHSPVFPPHDPWLSGYAISYYYFGYVLVAMLARMTGVVSGVAFNLASSLWFALAALGAYGILYNLLSLRFNTGRADRPNLLARGWALLAPAFLLIISNLEGFLEMLHAKGLFWTQAAAGGQSSFWAWIDLQELVNPPTHPLSWIPQRPGGIWWWRASRVVQDYNLAGQSREVIDEFPFFSYLLADLHPHVLAMPFALLAIGLALNFFLESQKRLLPELGIATWVRLWAQESAPRFSDTRLGAWMRTPGFWLAAVALGGMAFVNTWDLPIYIALFSAAYVLARFQQDGWNLGRRLGEFIEITLAIGLVGVLLYLPFYFGFKSQAGGFLPSLSFFTRGIHFWIMFGSLLVPALLWLISLWLRRVDRASALAGLKFSLLTVLGLWALSYLLSSLIVTVLSVSPRFASLGGLFYGLHGAQTASQLIFGSLLDRFKQPGMWLSMIVILTLIWSLLASYRPEPVASSTDEAEAAPAAETTPSANSLANVFVLLLLLLGGGLVLMPEFFYLRDQFGGRMNTIFKFYFEAWMVLSLAAAYSSVVIWKALHSAWGWFSRLVWVVVVLMALAYPIFGLYTKTNDFNTTALNLDGNAYLTSFEPDEMAAIGWLSTAPQGYVVEAVGGQYSAYARVGTWSGQATVLGWPGHESQWRGGAVEMGTREADISTLYRTNDWIEALTILKKYNIRYIYIGSLERSTYHISESKFESNLRPVFQNKSVIIYELPPDISQPGS